MFYFSTNTQTALSLIESSKKHIKNCYNQNSNSQIFASKNLFSTILPSARNAYNASLAFNIKNVKPLEFGSSALYLEEMRNAVHSLLKSNSLNDTERKILTHWSVTSEITQNLAWVLDYFRVCIPTVLDQLIKGEDPSNSLLVKALAPFYKPNQTQLLLMSEYIVSYIKRLIPGSFLGIPHGNLMHETMLCVVRQNETEYVIYHLDSNKQNLSK